MRPSDAAGRAHARASGRVQCAVSRSLCARAEVQRTRSAELRQLAVQQRRDWRGRRRLHRRDTRGADPAVGPWPGAPRAARPVVRVCMDCARVYAALPLAASEREADVGWRTVPLWVREGIRAGHLGVVPSHGICPACARLRGWDE